MIKVKWVNSLHRCWLKISINKQLVHANEQQCIFAEIRENCVWMVGNCSGCCDVSVCYCKCCTMSPTQSSMVWEHNAVLFQADVPERKSDSTLCSLMSIEKINDTTNMIKNALWCNNDSASFSSLGLTYRFEHIFLRETNEDKSIP